MFFIYILCLVLVYLGIFGPTKENQIWRVKTNKELDKLIKHKNIITLKLKD